MCGISMIFVIIYLFFSKIKEEQREYLRIVLSKLKET